MKIENCGCYSIINDSTSGTSNVSIEGLDGITVNSDEQNFQIDGKQLQEAIEKKQDKIINHLELNDESTGNILLETNDDVSQEILESSDYSIRAIASTNEAAAISVGQKNNQVNSYSVLLMPDSTANNISSSGDAEFRMHGNANSFELIVGDRDGITSQVTSTPDVLAAWQKYLGIGDFYYHKAIKQVNKGLSCSVMELRDTLNITIYGNVSEVIKPTDNKIPLLYMSDTGIGNQPLIQDTHVLTLLSPTGEWEHFNLMWDTSSGPYLSTSNDIYAGSSSVFEQNFIFYKE